MRLSNLIAHWMTPYQHVHEKIVINSIYNFNESITEIITSKGSLRYSMGYHAAFHGRSYPDISFIEQYDSDGNYNDRFGYQAMYKIKDFRVINSESYKHGNLISKTQFFESHAEGDIYCVSNAKNNMKKYHLGFYDNGLGKLYNPLGASVTYESKGIITKIYTDRHGDIVRVAHET